MLRNCVPRNYIFVALRFYYVFAFAVINQNYGRYCITVVIACHGIIIRAGSKYSQYVTGFGFRQIYVFYKYISAFATFSGNRYFFVFTFACFVNGIMYLSTSWIAFPVISTKWLSTASASKITV